MTEHMPDSVNESDFSLGEYLEEIHASGDLPTEGIVVLPYKNSRGTDEIAFMPETFNFVKWAKQNKEINCSINVMSDGKPRIATLRSNEWWFPLVYLCTDITLPIYLNMVANYLYERVKGTLKNDEDTVNLEVLFEDERGGKVKKFSYNGTYKALKKIDVAELMKE